MFSCINGATTMPYTLEQDLEAAAIDCPVLLVCADAPPEGMDRDEAYDRLMAG